jgi:hypothetical protein
MDEKTTMGGQTKCGYKGSKLNDAIVVYLGCKSKALFY